MAILLAFGVSCMAYAGEESAKVAPPKEAREAAVVPRPVSLEKVEGRPFAFDQNSLLVIARGAAEKSVQHVVRSIAKATGFEPNGQPKEKEFLAKIVTLKLDPAIGKGRPDWQAAESYTLDVAKDGNSVEIAASNEHGLFNGVQTFVQLLDKGEDGKWRVPSVKIEDYPRFQWRGYLLDTSRHFRTKAEVLRSLDLLALHKMNVFHFHLCDDQGWRIEIKKYPKLIEVGAKLPNYGGKTGDGWFYTQDEIKEIVAYAADRHITVMPEIEMPGHSTSATTSYPELSCNGKPSNALCVTKEGTFEFMANVLDEVAELFPSPFIHVGGDEVLPEAWRACPTCKKRMDELMAGKIPDDVVVGRVNVTSGAGVATHEDICRLQGEFMRRIDAHLAKKGKRMIGWDEILDGGLAKGSKAAAMAWRGDSATAAATSQGRDVAASVYPNSYLDNGIPLDVTYAVEPVPADMPEEKAKHILGVQGNMWGEHTPTQARVDEQTYPRLCALAEVGWTPRANRDFKDFSARLERHAERLKAYGITIGPKTNK
jgi:hexosaminidase